MNFEVIEHKSSRVTPILLAMAVSSLITSWALKTPELSRKADKLEVVEKKEIPKLRDIAGCQTQRARVATQEAVKSENGENANLAAIPHCELPPKLAAEKKAETVAAAPPISK